MLPLADPIAPQAARLLWSEPVQALVFIVLHVPLALAMRDIKPVATVHALGVLTLGLYWLVRDRKPHRVIYVATYMVGAEVLWRMTSADVFWEYGKYAVGLLLGLSLLRQRRLLRAKKMALLYFILLLPSVLLVIDDREAISFNMSGPFLLMVATLFFSTVTLTKDQIRTLLLVMIPPIAATAYLALDSTVTYREVIAPYMKLTSGGFGEDQVSVILGLGMFVAVLYVLTDRQHRWFRIVVLFIGIGLGTQSLLTMARGGLLTGVGALLVASFYLVRNKRLFGIIVLGGLLFYVFADQVIIPFADDLTGGALTMRYVHTLQEGDYSGRDLIMKADLTIFKMHPVLGVGPGGAIPYRFLLTGWGNAAHTEFSRMLAEHGLFGLGALVLLLLMAVRRVFKPGTALQRALQVSFLAWPIATMLHAAMRIAAPEFFFGLAFATILFDRYSRFSYGELEAGQAPQATVPPSPGSLDTIE
jgi:hypothetical protein